MVASSEAIADSGLNLDKIDKFRVGVIWGAGIGGIDTFQTEVFSSNFFATGNGSPRFNPFFIPKMIADTSQYLYKTRVYGAQLYHCFSLRLCKLYIIDALAIFRLGHCDVIVTGGSEATINESGVGAC